MITIRRLLFLECQEQHTHTTHCPPEKRAKPGQPPVPRTRSHHPSNVKRDPYCSNKELQWPRLHEQTLTNNGTFREREKPTREGSMSFNKELHCPCTFAGNSHTHTTSSFDLDEANDIEWTIPRTRVDWCRLGAIWTDAM